MRCPWRVPFLMRRRWRAEQRTEAAEEMFPRTWLVGGSKGFSPCQHVFRDDLTMFDIVSGVFWYDFASGVCAFEW